MENDLSNFKKWLKKLGLEINGKTDDEALKKLIPPQRRDMWRHIMSHVLPEKEVELIKKSILLHKLQKRQKPLMAKVESDEDLDNAIKYEELMTKYDKIQKDIIDIKMNNNKIKTHLDEKNEQKRLLIKNIESKQNTLYLTKHEIEYNNKFIEKMNETSNICNHFSNEVNTELTKTDYEDSLIKCLIKVDNAKQSGIMKDGVNVGNQLCNDLYTTIQDKSPIILLQTIEENLIDHINKSTTFISEKDKIIEDNDNKNALNELLEKLVQKQLDLKSKLSYSLAEKDRILKQLKETTVLEKNEIISLYKLKYILSTDQELQVFKTNLKETFQTVIINSINHTKISNFHENASFEKETFNMLDVFSEKTNILNDKINQKKIIVDEMLKEFVDKKSDFELVEVKTNIDNLAEDYLKKININLINKKIIFLKEYFSSGINDINKLTIRPVLKPNVIHFQTLQESKHYSEMIDILSTVTPKFEQFNNIKSDENDVYEITQKENMHKSKFDNIMCELENKILDLSTCIEDCKLVESVMSTMQTQNVSSSNQLLKD